MVKKPKPNDKSKIADDDLVEAVQDAVEDAVVVEETPAEPEIVEEGAMLDEPTSDSVIEETQQDERQDNEPATDDASEREETTTDTPVPVPAPQKQSGAGGFVALLLGGAIAAGIGFGAARYVVPDGWPFPGVTPANDPTAQVIEAQGALIEQLTAQIDGNAAQIEQLKADTNSDEAIGALKADMVAGQAHLTEDISAMAQRLDETASRLTALEKIPQGDGAAAANAAAQAYERELASMRAMLDTELAKITAAQEDTQELKVTAAQAAKAAAARAALSRIMAALETGRPFDQAVFDYETATGANVPAELASLATEGAPTLASLQDDFPDLALAALDASIRASVEDGSINKMNAFLRTQLGMRSLEPKEGDDPDAILSRAEFALKNGDIAGALAGIETLPDVSKPILADWAARAQTRADALKAGQSLAEMNK